MVWGHPPQRKETAILNTYTIRIDIELPEGAKEVPGAPRFFATPQGTIYRLTPTYRLNQCPVLDTGKEARIRNHTGHSPQHLRIAPLVCALWHGERPSDRMLGYKDGDHMNLSRDNLSWVPLDVE